MAADNSPECLISINLARIALWQTTPVKNADETGKGQATRALMAIASFVLAMPKLCCVLPVVLASGTTLAQLLTAVGVLGLAAELDQLCAVSGAGMLSQIPLLAAIALLAVSILISVTAFRGRLRSQHPVCATRVPAVD